MASLKDLFLYLSVTKDLRSADFYQLTKIYPCKVSYYTDCNRTAHIRQQ
jgi:hypothetical protein